MFWKCENGALETFDYDKDVKDNKTEIHTYDNARIWYDDPPVIFTMSRSNGFHVKLAIEVDGKKYDICYEMYDIRRLISWLIKSYKDLFGK